MDKAYSRITWQNSPSVATPLGATNLNRLDIATDAIDNRVVAMDTSKANVTTINAMVRDMTFNNADGKLTITYQSGTTSVIDTAMEKIVTNFSYNATTQSIDLTLADGSTQSIDISAFITNVDFENTSTVAWTVVEGKTRATVPNGSITDTKIESGYLANVTVQAGIATAQAALSKRYAVGGVVEGDETDNAKYYYEHAQAIVGVDIATTSVAGLVKPDGTTIDVDVNGVISVSENISDLVDDVSDIKAKKYRLQISGITQSLVGITYGDLDQKALCSVKKVKYRQNYGAYSNVETPDLTLGYLFQTGYPGGNSNVYYAQHNADNMALLGGFDGEATMPIYWNAAVGELGDILWVYGEEYTARASIKKPRVHTSGTYSTAPEVTTSGGNPISWLPSAGYDFARDGSGNEYCMFAEYTGLYQGTLHVWKVTKPYATASNWTKVMTKTQATTPYGTDGDIWHFHTCQYDIYSNTWYVTSGDGDDLIHVWKSSDMGANWTEVAGGSQIYRTLNYVFTKDYVYWSVDKANEQHALYRIGRDGSSIPDFSTITKLADLPSWQATYGTVRMYSPNGLLMLDRVDTAELAIANPMLTLYFWSFDDSTLYNVADIPVSSEFEDTAFGFRCKAITLTQGLFDTRILAGFVEYPNYMDIPYNENSRRYTMAMELI